MSWIDEAAEQLQKALSSKSIGRRKKPGEAGGLIIKDPDIYLAKLQNIISDIYKGQPAYEYFLAIQSARLSKLAQATTMETPGDNTSFFDIEQYQKKSRLLDNDYKELIENVYKRSSHHLTFPTQFFKILVRGESTDTDMLAYIGAYNTAEDGYNIYIPITFIYEETLYNFVYQFFETPSEILHGSNYVGSSLELHSIKHSTLDVRFASKIERKPVLTHIEIVPESMIKSTKRMEIFDSNKHKTYKMTPNDAKNYFLKAYRIMRIATFLDTARQEPFLTLLDTIEQTLLPNHKKTLLDRIPLLDEF